MEEGVHLLFRNLSVCAFLKNLCNFNVSYRSSARRFWSCFWCSSTTARSQWSSTATRSGITSNSKVTEQGSRCISRFEISYDLVLSLTIHPGLSLADLRAAVKIFRICRSFVKGMILYNSIKPLTLCRFYQRWRLPRDNEKGPFVQVQLWPALLYKRCHW